jgi:hypothetical protein
VEAIGLEWLDDSLHVTDLRTSLITYPEDGRLPATFDGVRRLPNFEDLLGLLGGAKEGPPPALASVIAMFTGGKKNSYTDFQPSERCLFGPDVPMVPQLDGNYIQIVQAADHVAIVSDFHRRIVALGKRPPLGDQLRSWSGTSTGRWDGETLIVETRNFNDRTPSFAGAGNSHDKIVTERFTRTVKDGLQYSATVVDPKTFKDRIELSFPMARVDVHIQESACHEGNRSLPNALSAARKEDEAIPPR